MSLVTKIIFIAALVLSIIIPFGYYLIGEKNKKRYKRTIGVNAFFFFGAFAIASIMMLAGPANVQAAEAAASSGATIATGMGYLATAIPPPIQVFPVSAVVSQLPVLPALPLEQSARIRAFLVNPLSS